MTYPQPDASQAVIAKQKFFRLITPLVSDGDIYESAQGAHAVALGPNSDVSKVNVAYFDPSQANRQSVVTIDTQRGFSGLIYAQNDEKYLPSNVTGKLLFWPANLFNPTYNPFPLAPTHSRTDYVVPVLDVIQYFQPPGTLEVARNDKTYHYQELNWYADATGNGNAIVIPFYGRKYAFISFVNTTNATVDYEIRGVNFSYANSALSPGETVLRASGAAAPALTAYNEVVRAGADGMFDALVILFANYSTAAVVPTGPVNLRITVSDNAL